MDIKTKLKWLHFNSWYGLYPRRKGDTMIEKCKTCESFNHDTGKMRNKLRYMFMCEDYQKEQHRQAMIYNRSVCGEEFDSKPLYEHGNRVYGSGLKEGK